MRVVEALNRETIQAITQLIVERSEPELAAGLHNQIDIPRTV